MVQPRCVVLPLHDCEDMINVCTASPVPYLRNTRNFRERLPVRSEVLFVQQHTTGVLDRSLFCVCARLIWALYFWCRIVRPSYVTW